MFFYCISWSGRNAYRMKGTTYGWKIISTFSLYLCIIYSFFSTYEIISSNIYFVHILWKSGPQTGFRSRLWHACGKVSLSFSWTCNDLVLSCVACFCNLLLIIGKHVAKAIWGDRWEGGQENVKNPKILAMALTNIGKIFALHRWLPSGALGTRDAVPPSGSTVSISCLMWPSP